jgi:hypothetical protein
MSKKQQTPMTSKYTDEDYKFLDRMKKANSVVKESEIAFKMFVEGDELYTKYNAILTETKTITANIIEQYEAYKQNQINIIAGKTNEEGDSPAKQEAANMKIKALIQKALPIIKSNLATLYPYTTYTAIDGKTPITTKEQWEEEVREINEQLKKHTTYNIL